MTPAEAPFRRVLIANRGEIAVRIIRACHELGMEAVAVYSDADVDAAHVRLADVAVRLGPAAPAESYLRIDAVIEAARSTDAEAIHPGYGFLAERAAFARAAEDAGIAFVGPSSATIEALGDKLNARRLAARVGVPSVPGTLEPAPIDHPDQVAEILATSRTIGFPLLVKAAAGGGGRGMRRVTREGDLAAALVSGSREALSAFGDGSVYLEREIVPARHIEVQLLADQQGHVVALGERDCSLQRRHQKLVEEAPAPELTGEQRRHLHGLAVRLGEAASARGDGARCRGGYRARAVPGRGRTAAQLRGHCGGGACLDTVEPRDRGTHCGGGSRARLRAHAGTSGAMGHALRSGCPGGHAHRGGRTRASGLRQPHSKADGPCA